MRFAFKIIVHFFIVDEFCSLPCRANFCHSFWADFPEKERERERTRERLWGRICNNIPKVRATQRKKNQLGTCTAYTHFILFIYLFIRRLIHLFFNSLNIFLLLFHFCVREASNPLVYAYTLFFFSAGFVFFLFQFLSFLLCSIWYYAQLVHNVQIEKLVCVYNFFVYTRSKPLSLGRLIFRWREHSFFGIVCVLCDGKYWRSWLESHWTRCAWNKNIAPLFCW